MKIALALLLALASTLVQAKIVTYSFNGVFDAPERRVMRGDPAHAPLFNGLIEAGDRFSGQFSFDTDAVAISGPEADFRWVTYAQLDFQLAASDAFNAAVPVWQPGHIQVTDDHARFDSAPYDELISKGSARVDGQHTLSTTLRMSPPDNSAFNDFRVPVGYQDFVDATMHLYLYHYDHVMYDYVSAQLQVALLDDGEVPEPATGILLLAGLGGLAALRRRR